MRFRRESLRLYLVLDPDHSVLDPALVATSALEAGASCIQLRWKSGTDNQVFRLAQALRRITHGARVPLIVNDRIDIALASRADGVHLGVDDLPVSDARALVGPDFVLGFSPESDAQILESAKNGATYLGIGPVFGSRTKADAGTALGVTELSRRCSFAPLPVVAIGGVTVGNIPTVFEAGADGAAVVSAIMGSSDTGGATRALSRGIERRR